MIYITKQFDNGFLASVEITDIDKQILSSQKLNSWLNNKEHLINNDIIFFKQQELALLFIKELSVYQEPTKYTDFFHNVFMEISNDKLYLSEDNDNKIFSFYEVELIYMEDNIPYSLSKEESFIKLQEWRII